MDYYEKQGRDFLKKHNVTMTVKFKKHGKHFENDSNTRDIYSVYLERGSRGYSFDFGQSINASSKWLKYGKCYTRFIDPLAGVSHSDKNHFQIETGSQIKTFLNQPPTVF